VNPLVQAINKACYKYRIRDLNNSWINMKYKILLRKVQLGEQ